MEIAFHGQVVLVTGGTRGIGSALADAFEEAGASLLLTGTSPERCAALNDEAEHNGRHRRYLSVDYTSHASLSEFVEQIGREERIDVCVNNAGINRINALDDVLLKDLDETIAVNLRAPTLVTQAVSGVMKRHGYGRIVNVGSIWGVIGKPKRSVYSLTKFGIHGLTVGSAVELASQGILINTVSPGFVMTDLTRANLNEREITTLSGQVPIARFAEPEEIATVVLFLASPLNTYVTAQNVVADGGFVHV